MLIQSERVRKALALSHGQFKRLFGVKKDTYNKMLEILQEAYEKLHTWGGKPTTKLHVEDKLLLALQYHREYRSMEHIGFDYDVVKSAVHDAIVWVEDTLIREGTFRLPGKKSLIAGEQKPKTVLVDVTEHPIERPKKSRETTTPARKNNIP
jgi:predicted DNA-binding protein YlxM (UPF0122 family)